MWWSLCCAGLDCAVLCYAVLGEWKGFWGEGEGEECKGEGEEYKGEEGDGGWWEVDG